LLLSRHQQFLRKKPSFLPGARHGSHLTVQLNPLIFVKKISIFPYDMNLLSFSELCKTQIHNSDELLTEIGSLQVTTPTTSLGVVYGYKYTDGDGLTTICLSGFETSPPPACFTNSAGVRKLPWHTQTILTSSPFLYLYRKPSILLPLGPSTLDDTIGMSSIMIFLMSPLLLLVPVVRDPSVRSRGCSVAVPFSGFPDDVGGSTLLCLILLSEADMLLASVICTTALPARPGKTDKNLIFLDGKMQEETGGTVEC
jgi:hypothetical protein